MSRRDVGVLACRILGLYAILQSLQTLPILYEWVLVLIGFPEDDYSRSFTGYAMGGLLTLIFGVLLLTAGGAIGERLARVRVDPDKLSATAPIESPTAWTAALAFAALGLMDLLTSIPALADGVGQLARDPEDRMWFGSSPWFERSVAAAGLRVVLGLWLVLGARGWAKALRYLRRTGLQPHERAWERKTENHGIS